MKFATSIFIFFSLLVNSNALYSQIMSDTSVFIIDSTNSYVTWNCDSHHGTVPVKNGIFKMTANNIISGSFVIQMDSIKDLDIDYPLMRKTLENTLKSEFFFDVSNYPTAYFEIDHTFKKDNNKYLIVGDMWITGLVNCIQFTSTINIINHNEFTAVSDSFKINRINWNLTIYSKDEAKSDDSVIISDSIGFVVHLQGKIQSQQ